MKNLIKKEFLLALHPTMLIFLLMPLLVFAPNYPYEVIFFFSGLSTFFYCLQARENKDIAFSMEMPIKKQNVPIAKIITVSCFQCVLIIITLIFCFIKQAVMSPEMLINQAGISANLALVGNGAVILGIFNLVFFSLVFKNPNKIGKPFIISSIIVFLLISLLIVLRFTTPLFSTLLNGSNDTYLTAKLLALIIGLILYFALTTLSAVVASKNFKKVDL